MEDPTNVPKGESRGVRKRAFEMGKRERKREGRNSTLRKSRKRKKNEIEKCENAILNGEIIRFREKERKR